MSMFGVLSSNCRRLRNWPMRHSASVIAAIAWMKTMQCSASMPSVLLTI